MEKRCSRFSRGAGNNSKGVETGAAAGEMYSSKKCRRREVAAAAWGWSRGSRGEKRAEVRAARVSRHPRLLVC